MFDNKIIGNRSDVKANTIGYRIPTQAQSSIHALRFVDVVPAVKSTVILPTEFTKITGSDFDIDHLYWGLGLDQALGRAYFYGYITKPAVTGGIQSGKAYPFHSHGNAFFFRRRDGFMVDVLLEGDFTPGL